MTDPINPSQFKRSSAPPPPDPKDQDAEYQRRVAWITKVKGLHRNKRMLGFAGIILGAALVVWARLSPDQAPGWALYAGFGVLAVSWAIFIYVIIDRSRWIKNNPYKPGGSSH